MSRLLCFFSTMYDAMDKISASIFMLFVDILSASKVNVYEELSVVHLQYTGPIVLGLLYICGKMS